MVVTVTTTFKSGGKMSLPSQSCAYGHCKVEILTQFNESFRKPAVPTSPGFFGGDDLDSAQESKIKMRYPTKVLSFEG